MNHGINSLETGVLSAINDTGWRKIFAAVAMFATGFVVVAGAVHLAVGNPLRLYADMRSEKLMVMDEWQGRAYSAAFGSSHVHYGFDPRSFDLAMAGTPLQTRSLNLAIRGGSQGEQRATAMPFLEHLQRPTALGQNLEARACMVVLELNAGANFTNDHLVHPRAINIYDWRTARFVWGLTDPQMSQTQRVGRRGYALVAMALHYANLGMLSSKIFTPPVDTVELNEETVDDRRGLMVEPPLPGVREVLEKIIAEAPSHPTGSPQPLLASNREMLEDLKAASPVKNVLMVYVVMPKLSDLTEYEVPPDSLEWSGGTAPIINMARPDLYPEIYQAKYWFDDVHLNERGAALLTKLMANSLKSWYAAHSEPARCGG
jgi:hypothetical protein